MPSSSQPGNSNQSPNWQIIDEISIPLLESGVGTLPMLQAALPSILAIDVNSEEISNRYRKILRIAQFQIRHLLKSQYELLKKIERNERKMSLPARMSTYKCEDCGKMFVNESYLLSHFERRHNRAVKRLSSSSSTSSEKF